MLNKYIFLPVLFLTIFVLPLTSSAQVSAGTVSKGNRKKVAPSTEPDDYNPASDPLPEWLILPEGVDENNLQYSGDQNTVQTITSVNGNEKWVIKTKNDGKSIIYKYYEANKLQFGIKTTANYLKVGIYDNRGKKLKTVSSEDFFDDAQSLAQMKTIDGTSNITLARGGDGLNSTYGTVEKKARKNKKLSKRQINKLASKAGFRGNGRRMAVAISQAESGGRIGTVLCNWDNRAERPSKPFEKGVRECRRRNAHSADRGLWQINNHWHRNVSNRCSFSPKCTAKAAHRISNGGGDWNSWTTFRNGLYRGYL